MADPTVRAALRGACRTGCRLVVRTPNPDRLLRWPHCEFIARNQCDHHREVIDRCDDELTLAVESKTAPVDPADVARRENRAAHARRREDAFRAVLRNELATLAAIVESQAPGILRSDCRVRNEWGRRRKGLRRGHGLAGRVALRYGPLDDLKDWITGFAVEDEQHPCLRGLNHGGDQLTVSLDIDEHWLRRNVEVPNIVMYELPMPDDASGVRAQRDDGVCVRVVAKPLAAEEIRARGTGGYEDETARRINRQDRPRVRGSCAFRIASSPASCSGLRVARGNRIPRPAQQARCARRKRVRFRARARRRGCRRSPNPR